MQATRINDRLTVAGQITKDEIAAAARAGFKLIINNRPDDEEPGQLSHIEAEQEARRQGIGYLYQPIVTPAITRADVQTFRDAVAGAPGPVLAHCRSGTRCHLLYSLGEAAMGGKDPRAVVEEAAERGYDLRVLPQFLARIAE